MTCSARSFGDAASAAAAARSASGVSPRERVPLIGRVSMAPSAVTARNRSGEFPTSAPSPSTDAISAAWGAGARARKAAASATGTATPGAHAADSRRERFTWYASPARRYSRMRSTPDKNRSSP